MSDNIRRMASENYVQKVLESFVPSGCVPATRKVNGKALSEDISLDASDVGALGPVTGATNGHFASLDGNGKLVDSGKGASDFCGNNDSRLADARNPNAHGPTHGMSGTDPITPSSIGAADSSHTHAIADVTGLASAIAQKAAAADLPYRLVEPGEWEFSDGLSHEISGPNEVIDPGEGAASFWVYSSSYNGVAYYSQHFETESLALETLAITFSHIGDSFTATRASLPGHLLDRASNRVVVSGATTLTLPALEHAGKARDFLVKVTTSADDLNITWQGQGSEAPNGADELQFVTEDGDFPVVGTAGDYLFSFTEVEAHTFAVSMKPIVAAPQAQGGS